jgi:alpha-1,3-glucan synthase
MSFTHHLRIGGFPSTHSFLTGKLLQVYYVVSTNSNDRLANGDPSNDNANGTAFEQDIHSNQFRHGGDLAGLEDSLDYLQGMGIKALYIAGSPFINQPWTADSYSPLDFTILDHHFGTIEQWRNAIDQIHARGMYVVS